MNSARSKFRMENRRLPWLTCRRRSERGSALMLVPTTFLVLVILTLFTINSALRFLGQQELERLASSAANNSVSGVSTRDLYNAGEYSLRFDGVRELSAVAVSPRTDSVENVSVEIVELTGERVTVRARGVPKSIMSRLLPWSATELSVTVSAEADKDQ